MRKLKIRFCQWNLAEEGSQSVKDHVMKQYGDLAHVEELRCLGNCSICNQGPYCTVNDFLFQQDNPQALKAYLDQLLDQLRKGLAERSANQRNGVE